MFRSVRKLVVVVPVALVAMAAFAVARSGAAPSTSAQAANPDRGRAIWNRSCAYCHGSRGQGSFQGPAITTGGTALVDFMVRTGRMPVSFHSRPKNDLPRGSVKFTDQEIRDLVAYTAQFVNGPTVPEVGNLAGVDVAAGGTLYRLNCAACHQMAGSGGALAYGTVGPSLHASTPTEVLEAMRTGPGSMPVFPPELIGQQDARQIAAYVQYLSKPDDAGGFSLWRIGPVAEGLIAWVFGIGIVLLLCRWLGERDPVMTD